MAEDFEIDSLTSKLDALTQTSQFARQPTEAKSIIPYIEGFVTEAIAQDRHDLALQASKLLIETARRSRDIGNNRSAAAMREQVQLAADAYAKVKQSLDVLN